METELIIQTINNSWEALSAGGQHVYEAARRKAIVSASIWLVIGLLWLVASILVFRCLSRIVREIGDAGEGSLVGAAGIILFVVGASTTGNSVSNLLSLDWRTIELLRTLIE